MRSNFIQILISLLLILGILTIAFVFIFKSGNISGREFWHTLLILFILALIVLNMRPHWSVEKKYRRFFREFFSETGAPLQQKLFDNPSIDLLDGDYRTFSRIIAGT